MFILLSLVFLVLAGVFGVDTYTQWSYYLDTRNTREVKLSKQFAFAAAINGVITLLFLSIGILMGAAAVYTFSLP